MVALDGGAAAHAALDAVGIDGALEQEVRAGLAGLLLKHAHEQLADDLALALRIGHALQRLQKALGRIHMDDVQAQVVLVGFEHLFGLVLAQQAVIHEHAGQLAGLEGTVGQHAGHGGIHAAGDAADHPAVAHLLTDAAQHALDLVLGLVLLPAAADAAHEVFQHLRALHRVLHLGMELHAVEAAGGVGELRVGAGVGVRGGGKALRQAGDPVVVIHEHMGLAAHAVEEGGILGAKQRIAVFAHVRALHRSAVEVVEQLHAVADAQHGNAQAVHQAALDPGRAVLVDAGGAAGENHAAQGFVPPERAVRAVGQDFAIHAHLAHPPRNQLVVLAAKIENDDLLAVHLAVSPFLILHTLYTRETGFVIAIRLIRTIKFYSLISFGKTTNFAAFFCKL